MPGHAYGNASIGGLRAAGLLQKTRRSGNGLQQESGQIVENVATSAQRAETKVRRIALSLGLFSRSLLSVVVVDASHEETNVERTCSVSIFFRLFRFCLRRYL